MPAGHPFFFPDPNERSPKDSTYFEDSATILSLYNQENSSAPMQKYCQTVIDWFCNYEKAHGWSKASPEDGTTKGVLLTNGRVRRAFYNGSHA